MKVNSQRAHCDLFGQDWVDVSFYRPTQSVNLAGTASTAMTTQSAPTVAQPAGMQTYSQSLPASTHSQALKIIDLILTLLL
jgi:hypothetical protein